MPEYERLEDEALPVETQTGGVKHNESTDLETRTPPFSRQTRHPEELEPDATMANDLLDPITESQTAADPSDGCELDVAFGAPVQEIPLWIDLYESIRDLFFPPKLPPLELTSTPIPVPDRMAVKRNPWAFGISATFNIGIAALAVFLGVNTYINNAKPKMQVTPIDVAEWKAPKSVVAAGGGGGSPDKVEAIKGKIPRGRIRLWLPRKSRRFPPSMCNQTLILPTISCLILASRTLLISSCIRAEMAPAWAWVQDTETDTVQDMVEISAAEPGVLAEPFRPRFLCSSRRRSSLTRRAGTSIKVSASCRSL